MTIQAVNAIAARYATGEITYYQAVNAIMNVAGWSQNDAEEYLNEVSIVEDSEIDSPPTEEENITPIKGIENQGSILNVAGYWVIGVGKGTLFMIVPMIAIGLSVGFMKRVINLGSDMGGA